MKKAKSLSQTAPVWGGRILGAAAVVGMLTVAGVARADDSYAMAPPVAGADAPIAVDAADSASQDTVFNWQEVPANQDVTITRAVFDHGGYQLYDNVGETIVVPFTNDNLYVMKFAVSHTGQTYFVNEGSAPVLYVPRDGYLENATVPGARWYPFPKDYHVDHPVYLGIAPSWDDYIDMGWYPNMVWYGGYYTDRPYYAGIGLLATLGLFFEIGGHHYYGWHDYQHYRDFHPDFIHIGYSHRDFYHWATRPFWGNRHFGGDHNISVGHGFGGTHNFGSHTFNNGHNFRGTNGGHAFGGGNHNTGGGNHAFGGGNHNSGGGETHAFGGGNHNSGGGNTHAFGGGNHAFGGGNAGGGNHAFGGGNTGGRNHGFGGGNAHAGGGDHGGGGNAHARGGDHGGGGGDHGGGGGDHGGGGH